MVTYKIVQYRNGVAQPLHYRYDYMKNTGVYDLREFPYASQTTMNIVVKNEKQIFFDTTLKQGEDQKYITENLERKLKIGYCSTGEYKYIRHEGSAAAAEAYSFYLFEQKMALWEDLFGKYEEVPRYIQVLVLSNYVWEINRDAIYPYHYKGKDFDNAIKRIKNILSKVDIDTILNMPRMDTFHKHFWISMKEDISPVMLAKPEELFVMAGEKKLLGTKVIEIVLNKIRVENQKLFLYAFVKSPIFNYTTQEPHVIAVENGCYRKEVSTFDSINSCYKTKMRTNNFFGFIYECDVNEIENFYFEIEIDGIRYNTKYYCMPVSVFNAKIGINRYIRNNVLIKLSSNIFELSKVTDDFREIFEKETQLIGTNEQIERLRKGCINYNKRGKVWIYSDSMTVKYDNAYYQFVSDFGKDDGIERWYVYDRELSDIAHLFTEQQQKYLVKYGSNLHKLLYLCAEYIICSFSDLRPRIPFKNDAEIAYYRDLFSGQTIYLQHGVLHADLRYAQSAERCKVDKIVVSSYFEEDNYFKNYHYRKEDLIPTGMARYDYIDKNKKAKNRILFAPSWRSYLVGRNQNAQWEKNSGVLLKSDYYNKFIEFLTSKKLEQFLEENDLYLDAKLHQNMRDALDVFELNSKRINVVETVEIEDYSLFITDFSSYVFDYAYLNRPIFYFVPDMEQFESGMNHYRKLDLPFEKAFGNLTLTADEAVNELIRIAKNDFTTEEPFKERMDRFYLPLEDCCESLYKYLINN